MDNSIDILRQLEVSSTQSLQRVSNDLLNRSKLHPNKQFPVILTSYEVACQDKEQLCMLGFFAHVVIDEVMDHRKTLLSGLNKFPCSTHTFLLSGDHLNLCLNELAALLMFVMPRMFDEYWDCDVSFQALVQNITKNGTEVEKEELAAKLYDKLKPYCA